MNLTDYIPHGLVVALGGIVGYVFREHTARDDARFNGIASDLRTISIRQIEISDKMAENHAELLRVMLESERRNQA